MSIEPEASGKVSKMANCAGWISAQINWWFLASEAPWLCGFQGVFDFLFLS
jgi:hypothetical protein